MVITLTAEQEIAEFMHRSLCQRCKYKKPCTWFDESWKDAEDLGTTKAVWLITAQTMLSKVGSVEAAKFVIKGMVRP